ncbi:hypothetical protein [Pseudomonas putida]|uniref:hypothetical protein n=1 Tax=Pseudomonas putida TaxID=303 RepID=UPI00236661AB|nr:hypothetical protein [Pseudomonas putida]MDD2049401.1 hypothetical protein [Pseudomonas putida]
MFGYRLMFLALFMLSAVTWIYLTLIGFSQQKRLKLGRLVIRPGVVAFFGFLLVLACAVLDFFRVVEESLLLLALVSIGLIVPWGGVLATKCHAHACPRKYQINK